MTPTDGSRRSDSNPPQRGEPARSGSRPLVYVIVLSWNGKDDTMTCLASLMPLIGERTRVLVVDNGSTDGTFEAVRSLPEVEILRNEQNLGFPGGNNVGIRHALERGADYVVLLNNDTVVDSEFVDALLDAAAGDPAAGLLSSKIYYFDRPDVLWFAGATLSTVTGRTVHIDKESRDTGRHDDIREIDRPCGCSLMASRRFLAEVGLMDERLFLYGDEIDWTLRARKAGFGILFVPRSKVWHKVAVTSGGEKSGASYYYSVRNMLYLLNRHVPLRFGPLAVLRNLLVISVFVASIFVGGVDKKNGLKNCWLGFRDYLAGRMGRKPAHDARTG